MTDDQLFKNQLSVVVEQLEDVMARLAAIHENMTSGSYERGDARIDLLSLGSSKYFKIAEALLALGGDRSAWSSFENEAIPDPESGDDRRDRDQAPEIDLPGDDAIIDQPVLEEPKQGSDNGNVQRVADDECR